MTSEGRCDTMRDLLLERMRDPDYARAIHRSIEDLVQRAGGQSRRARGGRGRVSLGPNRGPTTRVHSTAS